MLKPISKNITAFSFVKNWSFFALVLLHFFIIVFLTGFTSYILAPKLLPIYLIFSGMFLVNTLFSLNTILRFQTGVFYYLLNIMFLLGFWFKYSIQKITSLNYREPIGTFVLNTDAEIRILWVVIYGVFGFFISQVCSYYIFKKTKNINKLEEKHSFHKKAFAILLLFTLLLTLLNLKFNILLLGLKPSLILPFKGNAVYFLMLTRGTILMFFFYCLKTYSNKAVFWGALIATICSIGVLSRMVVLTYFSVLFIFTLQNMAIWRIEKTFKNILALLLIFSIFSYLTVLISTGFRNKMYATQLKLLPNQLAQSQLAQPKNDTMQTQLPMIQKNGTVKSSPEPVLIAKYFDFREKIQTYKELALGRWVGIEGVMAVDSYPKKSFVFLRDALKEKGYHGSSFYTQISNPGLLSTSSTSGVISTSVPGPIAFFYYSGNRPFVLFAIFVSTLLFSGFEQVVFKFFNKTQTVGIFVSTFMVFDFFQFGISPLAFVRYWCFSFFSIAVFYFFTKYYPQQGAHEKN